MEHKGNLLIWDLWQKGATDVYDIRVMNTDTKYYAKKTPDRFIHKADKAKKKNHPKACIQKRQQFLPLYISVDAKLGAEAEATLKRIASRLTTKWQQP